MTHPIRRLPAALLGWSHPLRGALSVAAMFAAAGILSTWLSPADAVRGNNRAAAAGVLFVALAGAVHVVWRWLRYARLRRRAGCAPAGTNGMEAGVEAGRYLGLDALAAILVLAPIVGREGYPLWALGYGEPVAWFGAGALTLAAVLTVIWPDWSMARGQRRLLPRISAAVAAMDRSRAPDAASRAGRRARPDAGHLPGHGRTRPVQGLDPRRVRCAILRRRRAGERDR